MNTNKKSKLKTAYNISDDVLAEIPIDKKLKVKILKYKDAFYIDIRKYFGIYPSRKGIRISTSVFSDLVKNKEIMDKVKSTL
jgi:hypothetical protein